MAASESPEQSSQIGVLFRAQRARLFGLAYRLTGSTEDAEDVVQEAFARLVAEPPATPVESLGPWLVRVATNLGIDAPRQRRRRAYAGPWLPSPLESDDGGFGESAPTESQDPEARYGLAESATFAFLVALEALGPRQRAVLLLRDVLGYSADETAAAIGASPGNVRVLHLRARRALLDDDQARCIPTAELREQHLVASRSSGSRSGDTPSALPFSRDRDLAAGVDADSSHARGRAG